MPAMNIILDGAGAWPDLEDNDKVTWLGNDAPNIQIAALPDGMESGRPSVAIRLDLPDGQIVVAETSLRLLLSAADAFKARLGDPREDFDGKHRKW